MDYRRGLQRVYAVLALVWLAATSWVIISGRAKPWTILEDKSPPTYTADPSELRELTNDEILASHEADVRRRWVWSGWLGVGVPVAGYILLFLVAPWIYSGFRPTPPRRDPPSDKPIRAIEVD